MRCCVLNLIAILQKILKIFFIEMSLKFTDLKLWSNLPEANELKVVPVPLWQPWRTWENRSGDSTSDFYTSYGGLIIIMLCDSLTHCPLGHLMKFCISNSKLISVLDDWGISCAILLIWMSMGFTDKSTLVQVMAWCHQATSHYLNQC